MVPHRPSLLRVRFASCALVCSFAWFGRVEKRKERGGRLRNGRRGFRRRKKKDWETQTLAETPRRFFLETVAAPGAPGPTYGPDARRGGAEDRPGLRRRRDALPPTAARPSLLLVLVLVRDPSPPPFGAHLPSLRCCCPPVRWVAHSARPSSVSVRFVSRAGPLDRPFTLSTSPDAAR